MLPCLFTTANGQFCVLIALCITSIFHIFCCDVSGYILRLHSNVSPTLRLLLRFFFVVLSVFLYRVSCRSFHYELKHIYFFIMAIALTVVGVTRCSAVCFVFLIVVHPMPICVCATWLDSQNGVCVPILISVYLKEKNASRFIVKSSFRMPIKDNTMTKQIPEVSRISIMITKAILMNQNCAWFESCNWTGSSRIISAYCSEKSTCKHHNICII